MMPGFCLRVCLYNVVLTHLVQCVQLWSTRRAGMLSGHSGCTYGTNLTHTVSVCLQI